MYQHGYNISLVEMVDKISNPLVKASMTEWMYKALDAFPTPADYVKALSTCESVQSHTFTSCFPLHTLLYASQLRHNPALLALAGYATFPKMKP